MKHIYIGSRRIAYAGSDVDDANVKYVDKYSVLQQTIKDRYADFEVPYNGNYVNCQYYYHSDYLGSTSFEERNNKWNTPYLFNAKESDEETGLYYYGARYYDARVSLWLGAEKYPNVSTYAYCVQNPVKFMDPDGMWIEYRDETGSYCYNNEQWEKYRTIYCWICIWFH